jgi:excisionase family DNA binding protein
MNSLDLKSAANFLGLHPNTLQARAKAGEIPGAKIGKEWRFLDIDLAEYMRSQYPTNKAGNQPPRQHLTSAKARPSVSSQAAYEAALGLTLRRKKTAASAE